eukprot:CAMPEP_0114490614 /NCGR_PEP_ID=MMETSP0109-20121206/2540_1 /TAXON_ID=29199 /ORGANISM="Chlorarachnion reptans, Strain CCCM449" /LENGTH=506 /DNA_ID=CAMNT_0001667251 /DNA_START=39 /DNA_END=1560 /DNA_ORIENTATION=-
MGNKLFRRRKRATEFKRDHAHNYVFFAAENASFRELKETLMLFCADGEVKAQAESNLCSPGDEYFEVRLKYDNFVSKFYFIKVDEQTELRKWIFVERAYTLFTIVVDLSMMSANTGSKEALENPSVFDRTVQIYQAAIHHFKPGVQLMFLRRALFQNMIKEGVSMRLGGFRKRYQDVLNRDLGKLSMLHSEILEAFVEENKRQKILETSAEWWGDCKESPWNFVLETTEGKFTPCTPNEQELKFLIEEFILAMSTLPAISRGDCRFPTPVVFDDIPDLGAWKPWINFAQNEILCRSILLTKSRSPNFPRIQLFHRPSDIGHFGYHRDSPGREFLISNSLDVKFDHENMCLNSHFATQASRLTIILNGNPQASFLQTRQILTVPQCQNLVEVLNKIAPSRIFDFKVDISRKELIDIIGRDAVARCERVYPGKYNRVRLRRCSAHGKHINFHTDHANKTMQIALNEDYVGGKLVYERQKDFILRRENQAPPQSIRTILSMGSPLFGLE